MRAITVTKNRYRVTKKGSPMPPDVTQNHHSDQTQGQGIKKPTQGEQKQVQGDKK